MRICSGETVSTSAVATSSCFYVIRGSGKSNWGDAQCVSWAQGDLFTVPGSDAVLHSAGDVDCALYYVSDAPLLSYLGVVPSVHRFQPTHWTNALLRGAVADLAAEGGEHSNRLGVLLGTASTESSTKTLTHTLWSLLNMLPARAVQPPHRHNSVALDLAVSAPPHGCYTLMGAELGEDGWVKDPVRADWEEGSVFSTPPGWWHSHHNESDVAAWVLPVQDAGLYTHQRTLDIRFSVGMPRGKSTVALDQAA